MKQIKINPLAYEMLIELSKKKRVKPEEFLEGQIKELYNKSK